MFKTINIDFIALMGRNQKWSEGVNINMLAWLCVFLDVARAESFPNSRGCMLSLDLDPFPSSKLAVTGRVVHTPRHSDSFALLQVWGDCHSIELTRRVQEKLLILKLAGGKLYFHLQSKSLLATHDIIHKFPVWECGPHWEPWLCYYGYGKHIKIHTP